MIILTLDAKRCMAELLLRETFDGFLFIEGEITTFNKFSIDGYVHKEFYGDASSSETVYSTWDKLRDFCFAIIKGKRTPLDFKFIFSLPDDAIRRLIEDKKLDFQPETVQGLYLNFRYNGSVLTCTTGTSIKIFTMDKSLEQAFDQWTGEFFSNHEVGWSVL